MAAQKYLDLAVTRYKGGITSYLEVTTAQTPLSPTKYLRYSVMLVQALGGGWDRSALP